MEREARFELLYARHAPAVKGYLLRRCDHASVDDALAEVFVVCWRRLHELPADPLPWLLGVARRVLSTHRRSERRRLALQSRLAETLIESIEVHSTEDRVLVDALARLSETDQELLLLIAWEGLTPSQVATVLGAKPATVRVRLLRARRRLSSAMARQVSIDSAVVPPSMEVSR
jgi:RNA polymerase sigma-70 factor, ECF subfamily